MAVFPQRFQAFFAKKLNEFWFGQRSAKHIPPCFPPVAFECCLISQQQKGNRVKHNERNRRGNERSNSLVLFMPCSRNHQQEFVWLVPISFNSQLKKFLKKASNVQWLWAQKGIQRFCFSVQGKCSESFLIRSFSSFNFSLERFSISLKSVCHSVASCEYKLLCY